MIKLYFFSFLSFLFFNLSSESYIIYPFKKSTKEIKSYPENLLQNDLEVTLKIGTPPQSIDLNLRSKVYICLTNYLMKKNLQHLLNSVNQKQNLKIWNTQKESKYPKHYM